ncbi:MAG TPA: phosphate acyltransferase PlsX [Methylocella sp.]|nr:phosphate acyltransferase PlsX [Methylocella sp.]
MLKPVRIAVDAMGGDHGPEIVVPGAARALRSRPDIEFMFFGHAARIKPLLDAEPVLRRVSTLHHTEVAVRMDDKPSAALRAGRRVSSMWLAVEAVKKNEADVAVSAGNTGALMAMAKFCLHTMPGIDRPAIAGLWPTLQGKSIVLDLGASIGGDAYHLVDLAIMGSAMARIVLQIERPSVGLLNIGVEEIKGTDEIKSASRLLRENPPINLDYRGFVEGDDIGKGIVDVVVTEGFTGNIAIKTAEGTANQFARLLREAMARDWLSRIGYLIARHAFASLKARMDPRHVNGGVFLGLNGVVIKSHGSSDMLGTAYAVEMGYAMARHQLLSKIRDSLPQMGETPAGKTSPTTVGTTLSAPSS